MSNMLAMVQRARLQNAPPDGGAAQPPGPAARTPIKAAPADAATPAARIPWTPRSVTPSPGASAPKPKLRILWSEAGPEGGEAKAQQPGEEPKEQQPEVGGVDGRGAKRKKAGDGEAKGEDAVGAKKMEAGGGGATGQMHEDGQPEAEGAPNNDEAEGDEAKKSRGLGKTGEEAEAEEVEFIARASSWAKDAEVWRPKVEALEPFTVTTPKQEKIRVSAAVKSAVLLIRFVHAKTQVFQFQVKEEQKPAAVAASAKMCVLLADGVLPPADKQRITEVKKRSLLDALAGDDDKPNSSKWAAALWSEADPEGGVAKAQQPGEGWLRAQQHSHAGWLRGVGSRPLTWG